MTSVFAVDHPTEGETIGAVIGIQGWVLSHNNTDDLIIEIFIDDDFLVKLKRNDIRPDVANAYPHIKNSDKSGFYVEAKLDKFEDGIHILKVIAKTSTNSEILCERKFSLIKKELLPPHRLIDYVGGDFSSIGKKFLNHFINLCHLKKNEHVLDIGCGSGRIAVALTNYLSSEGRYEGFDVVPEAIEWDQKYITSQFPNFNFKLADVYNKCYNKTGKKAASEFKFPYANESFDFVFLTSVFTHIRPNEIENYMSEISRVLRKNGRCLITCFLLNDESRNLMNLGKSKFNFKFNFDGFASIDEDAPERAIALPEDFVLKLFERNNLDIVKPIHYGGWYKENSLEPQDIVIALKK